MNSTLAETGSMGSTSTRLVRNNTATRGRLRMRADFYMWFFGQIHAKRLLVALQLFLLLVAFTGLALTCNPKFSGVPIPFLDGVSIKDAFTVPTKQVSPRDSTVVKISSPAVDTALLTSGNHDYSANNLPRNILTICSYFYILSVVSTLIALRWVEILWRSGSSQRCLCCNPGLLLIPFLISMASFIVPLLIWSVKTAKEFLWYECSHRNTDCPGAFDVFRYVLIPLIIFWVSYGYLLYGCVLSFTYVWRRAGGNWKTKEPASASFSWSFRDRNTLLNIKNSLGHGDGHSKHNHHGNRRNAGNSWRSTKSTDRPTLRSYISRQHDLNDSRASLISGDIPSVDNISQTGEETVIDIEGCAAPQPSPRGFGTTRRALDTVLEEGESHEGTLGSDASRL